MKTQDTIAYIRTLIDSNQLQEAIQLITRTKSQTDQMLNAHGVCLMRLGQVEDALKVLRTLAYQDQPAIAAERPVIIQANYATALLLSGDNLQAIDIIRGLDATQHPYVAKLKHTIRDVKKGLGLWGRFLWAMTLYPKTRIALDYAPGDLY